ncbi:hypothetical protein [Fodinicola feengrottensis]|uniref:hypothetical protein n=1 Tax=Fodinicola feengrottensis TaxID=435914 RepID=UPI0013CFF76B|nr:hypothetical protein [Fodinicola feengrottensis]
MTETAPLEKPTGVVTRTEPSALAALTVPWKLPVPTLPGANATGRSAWPPAGTVSSDAPTVRVPAGVVLPLGSVSFAAIFRVTAEEPSLW